MIAQCARPAPRATTVLLIGTRALTAIALTVSVASAAPGSRSSDGLWMETDTSSVLARKPLAAISIPSAFRAYRLDHGELARVLRQAPLEFTPAARMRPSLLTLPMPDGEYARFRIVESPILAPALAARHPALKTYSGQGLDDPTASVRFDLTPAGFHAQVLSASGVVLVDPYERGDREHYISYWKSAATPSEPFICRVTSTAPTLRPPIALAAPSGDKLRTYRLAMTATGEYSRYFGGPIQAIAAIITTVNRVNGIYEREVAARLLLVYIYAWAAPGGDPFPTGSIVDEDLLARNQVQLDADLGSPNYDVGHIVSQGGNGGLAYYAACQANWKARGGTSRRNPLGDQFDVDYVAHEIGHQFHADHTFNSTLGGCGNQDQRVGASAYEPGSGSTIMGYAGICGNDDVQCRSDPYFHTRSFDQIAGFVQGGACGAEAPTGNRPPTVDAGPSYLIPRNTAFKLTAFANDPDGDALTYCWEQFDVGSTDQLENATLGVLFRSRPPTTSPTRTFPPMPNILADVPDRWEQLPAVTLRRLHFRCTVRDNRAGGGGVSYDEMIVDAAGSPFEVTFPNGGEMFVGEGIPLDVNWSGGFMALAVNILYSADGGKTFPVVLAANTPNDGIERVVLPLGWTRLGRIKIEPTDNIFFDISDANFGVNAAPAPTYLPGLGPYGQAFAAAILLATGVLVVRRRWRTSGILS